MENNDVKAALRASNAKDEVLPAKNTKGLPMRPSDPVEYLRTGRGGSCMPPSIKSDSVSLPNTQIPSLLVKEGLDLSGESEDYTTDADGSRSLVERAEFMAEVESTIDAQYATRIAKTTALEEAKDKYDEYLSTVDETNHVIEKRKKFARGILILSGVLAAALIITLVVLGGI